TAHENIEKLAALARVHKPSLVVVSDPECRPGLASALSDLPIKVEAGAQALVDAACVPVDLVVMGIVGFAALGPSLAAVRYADAVALANKECLVVSGAMLMETAARHATRLLPVDSEHNGVFQLLDGRDGDTPSKIVLTASGGPFRGMSLDDMAQVTPEMAMAHPNWTMGAKISVDSATMMNKGLELIEARVLFDVVPEMLDVVLHPQSIVHAFVHFRDGSVLAHMATPDMRVPLAYCLGFPERMDYGGTALDLASLGALNFEPIERSRFPCLVHAERAMDAGGIYPTVLNAANEVAVSAFLSGKFKFTNIAETVAHALDAETELIAPFDPTTLAGLEACDKKTRHFCSELIKDMS
ncbi:MAG: 1-deoxy-D-xylulose-5-phosphate reductoisomerase, partial [Pseudomonadota bacterium]|nr:1-deoxy-D-xylulose-5-phosphate reductoisomerase [Pseudomonadota bacterium]